MARWNQETFWQRSLGVVFPCVMVSMLMDRELTITLLDLWEDPSPWRMLFFVSLAFLIVGLARNTARLRTLTERQAAEVGSASRPADHTDRAPATHLHPDHDPSREPVRCDRPVRPHRNGHLRPRHAHPVATSDPDGRRS
ncbi:MAG: hypothetical protein AB1555_11850 [Nitrospirota bacterium]